MKYCPFCGADLLSPEVSFCAECGKALPVGSSRQTETETALERPSRKDTRPRETRKKAAPARPRRKPRKNPGSSIEGAPTEKLSSRSGEDAAPEGALPDDYDGYYDDVAPLDTDGVRPGLDREMIKKIVLLVAGALLTIALCVVLMTVL